MTNAACPPGSLDTRVAMDTWKMHAYALEAGALVLKLDGGGRYVWTVAPE